MRLNYQKPQKQTVDMNLKNQVLIVREIFYSLQGEGSHAGEPSIFIRLAFCNKACWFCDTDWSYGENMTASTIADHISRYNCQRIIWTGGEPTLQLTSEMVEYFNQIGYKQSIETNGTNIPPDGLDYITCSPKVEVERLHKSFANHKVGEFRYPAGDKGIPFPLIKDLPPADYYYVSPLFLGEEKKRFLLDPENLQKCIDFVKANTQWRLSVQQHKIWNIL